jgi:hypothetical protein
MIFLEPIPNEVRKINSFHLTQVLTLQRLSFVLLRGHQNTGQKIWFMLPIGTISKHFSPKPLAISPPMFKDYLESVEGHKCVMTLLIFSPNSIMFPLKALYWGHKGARDNFSLQVRTLVEASYRSLEEKPVFIGECGVLMDMKWASWHPSRSANSWLTLSKGEAFESDNWSWQLRMMDAMMTALEQSLVGFAWVSSVS